MDQDTLLARWLAGELSEAELVELQKSPEFATLSRIRQNFETLEKPKVNSEAMLSNVLAHEKRSTKTVPLYAKRWFQVAAAVVILAGVAISLLSPTYKSADRGKTYAFQLPDHSEVILNSGSKADFSVWNWDKNRHVNLDGEAYFKVAKGKKFTVETNLGEVSVLGTQFNVRSRGSRFEVTCYEGKVRVRFDAEEFILTRGNAMVFDKGKQPRALGPDTAKPAWLQGEIVFHADKFGDVIAEIGRKYNVKITSGLQSEQLFTGTLPADDLDAAITIVANTYHLNVQKTEAEIILKP